MMGPFFSERFSQIQMWLQNTAIYSVKRKKAPESFEYYILCVDDDEDFCHYLERIGTTLSIKVDKALSIKEAKHIIERKSDYIAYIIDGHLPDGSGFELVAWIREKMGLKAPIAFLSRIYQDAASYRLLKESHKVNYVLDKPLRPEEVQHLFHQICLLKSSEEQFPDKLMEELKIEYDKTIYDKLENIEKLILKVQKKPNISNLKDLKNEVHKIAGSSGSYGYPQVSDLCKQKDEDLRNIIECAIEPDDKWLSDLDIFYTKLKMNFQGL